MTGAALVLRPEPSATRTARALADAGLKPLVHPLFEVRPCDWSVDDPARFDALMLTSANAVRHGGEGLSALLSLPVYAVGSATAEAAADRGFSAVFAGGNDAATLAARMLQDGQRRILHLCGADYRMVDLPALAIEQHIAYASEALEPGPNFFGDAARATVALVHSPRAAARLDAVLSAQGVDRSGLSLIAISANAAKAAGTGWREVAIAAKTRDEDMIELAAILCGCQQEGIA